MQNIVELSAIVTAVFATKANQNFFGNQNLWDNDGKKPAGEEPGIRHAATERVWVNHRLQPGQNATGVSCGAHYAPGPVENGRVEYQSTVDLLWHKYFKDPTEWWDNRNNKLHAKSPDFRHKNTKEGLWIDRWSTPQWVKKNLEMESLSNSPPGDNLHSGNQFQGEFADKAVLMPQRNAFSWTASISQHTKSGQSTLALRSYKEMIDSGVQPISYTFVAALKACSILQDLESAKQIHAEVVNCGCESDLYVGTMLVDVYGKCGRLVDARCVFEKMPQRNVVSWNAMISAYAHTEKAEEALELYSRMNREGSVPNARTFVAALKACSSLASLEESNACDKLLLKEQTLDRVRVVHAHVLKNGYQTDVFVGTMLVDAYAKCGSLVEARNVFDNMSYRNVVSWTAMVLGYAQMGEGERALQLYARMKQGGMVPDSRTFVAALKACSALVRLDEGNKSDFKQVEDWCLEQVRAIHKDIQKHGCESDVYVANMLVDVYAKCGSLEDARCVFQKMSHHDVVSWTAMILGYAEMGDGDVALQLYTRMQREGVEPDSQAFIGALKACSNVAALEKGKEIHAEILKTGMVGSDLFVANNLIDMYGKCGSMGDAQQVFDVLLRRDTVTWSALISGYARHGESTIVFDLFQRMTREGIKPDRVTFLSILTVCSCVGLVDKGEEYFKAMTKDYGITPTVDHYSCMVDLLGRVGQLDKAMDIAKTLQPNGVVWRTVLAACQKWSNVKLGRCAFELAISLDESDTAAYILMLNIYEAAHMLEDAKKIQAMREKTGAWKRKPGHSWWTDMGGSVHAFAVGDQAHPEIQGVHAKLRDLFAKLEEHGHPPQIGSLVQSIPCNGEDALCDESRKIQVLQLKTIKGTALTNKKQLTAAICTPEMQRPDDHGNQGQGMLADIDALPGEQSIQREHTRQNKRGPEQRDFGNSAAKGALSTDNWWKDWCVQPKLKALQDDINDRPGPTQVLLGRIKNGVEQPSQLLFKDSTDWWDYVGSKLHLKPPNFRLDSAKGAPWIDRLRTPQRVAEVLESKTSANNGSRGRPKCGTAFNDGDRSGNSVPLRSCPQDEFSWTALITQHTRRGEGVQALRIYEEMLCRGVKPSSYTFVAALKACSVLQNLKGLKHIHAHVVKSGLASDMYVGTMLVDGYAKCQRMVDARWIFEKMPHRTVVSWNAIILGYSQMEEGEVALQLYGRMQEEGVIPNARTYIAALKACSSLATGEDGNEVDGIPVKRRCLGHVRVIHLQVLKSGCELDVFVATTLVDVYAKCGSLEDARSIFEKMPQRNVVSWNAMILGYAQMEEGEEALQLYTRMQQEYVVPDDRTFVAALKACNTMAGLKVSTVDDEISLKTRCLEKISFIHSQVVKSGRELDIFVGTMLVNVYGKLGCLGDARYIFESMPHRNVVSWNAIILGYAQMGEGKEALKLYAQMQEEDVVPDDRTYVAALKACISIVGSRECREADRVPVRSRCLEEVRGIHSHVVKSRCGESAVYLGTMLVDAYSKCGCMVDARHVFEKMRCHDVVAWTAIIMGYVQVEDGAEALQLYGRMQKEGVVPDAGAFVGALKASGCVTGLEMGRKIHSQILDVGLSATESFLASSLIDMYAKCGSMVDAQNVFDTLPTRDIVTWSALIMGYAHQGDSECVFDLFQRLKQEGIQPDGITFLSLLTACSHAGLVDKGQEYFDTMNLDYGITPTVSHYSCMIDLLGRAGQLDNAMEMAKIVQSSSVMWRTVLSACRKWRNVELGRQAFEFAVRLDKDDGASYMLMSNIYEAADMLEHAKEIQTAKEKAGARKEPGQSWCTDTGGIVHAFAVGDLEHPASQYVFVELQDLFIKLEEEVTLDS